MKPWQEALDGLLLFVNLQLGAYLLLKLVDFAGTWLGGDRWTGEALEAFRLSL